MLGAALHGVQHGHGAAAAQQDQAGAQAVRGEELRDGNQDRAPRQDGPPLQERHQAELRHQLGDRRLRETGNYTYLLELQTKVRKEFTITEEATTRAFSWLKPPTSVYTFGILLRHYAKRAFKHGK